MALMSRSLAATLAGRHGVVTFDELLLDGFSRRGVARHVAQGTLLRVHNGVFRAATSPDTFEARCAAACAADPEVIITGVAAGLLWGFHHIGRPDMPIALVAHARSPITRGVLLRRTNLLDDSDRVERADGIRVASPPRAWFDCARDLGDEHFERLTEWVLDHHATMQTLWRTTSRMSARGRTGAARVNRVLSLRSDWQRPADSGLELRVVKALERRGVRPLVRQYPLRLLDGTVIHLDGAVPALRWAVEGAPVTWHGGRFDAQRDKARDRGARRVGWQVDRVTDQELADHFARAIGELVELHRLRSIELRAA
jgi:hypothetical protein